jgi:hypothetical protein
MGIAGRVGSDLAELIVGRVIPAGGEEQVVLAARLRAVAELICTN